MSFHTFPPGLSARVLALASCWPSAAIPPGRSSRVMSELRAHTQYMLCIQRKCVISRLEYAFLLFFACNFIILQQLVLSIQARMHTRMYVYAHSVLCIRERIMHTITTRVRSQYQLVCIILYFLQYIMHTVILRTLLLPACSTRLVFELRAVVPQLLDSSMQCIVLARVSKYA